MKSDNLDPADDRVPPWVHLAEVPPPVDDEPWMRHRVAPCDDSTCDICHAHVTPVGCWLLVVGVIAAVMVVLAVTRPWAS